MHWKRFHRNILFSTQLLVLPAGRPHTSWLATMKNDLSYHNLSVEDATVLALDRPLWRLLAASGAMQAEQSINQSMNLYSTEAQCF